VAYLRLVRAKRRADSTLVFCSHHSGFMLVRRVREARTGYEFLKGVDYIFVSLDRNLSDEECHELAEKYFETHKQMTLPGQVLLVDLRPLADVTPRFHAVSKGHTFTATITSRCRDARQQRKVFRAAESMQ